MVSMLLSGITVKLDELFNSGGDKYKIYTNNVEQGLESPAFFVSVIQSEVTPLLGRRCKCSASMDIKYFPESDFEKTDELLEVGDTLIHNMRFIELLDGSKVQGINRYYEVVDGVLHFFIDYLYTMNFIEEPDALMSGFELKGDVKNGG